MYCIERHHLDIYRFDIIWGKLLLAFLIVLAGTIPGMMNIKHLV
jgi:hypothetical protein